MRKFIFLILMIDSLLVLSQEQTAEKTKKNMQFYVTANQLERGFLTLESNFRFFKSENFSSYPVLGLSAGYNPWQEDLIFELKGYRNIFIFSGGASLSYIDPISTAEKSSWGIKPQLGIDLYVLKFYYGYYFSLSNRPQYLHYHNLSLSFFLFGRDEFHQWKEKSRWYSLGYLFE